jgi:hypothetical protein
MRRTTASLEDVFLELTTTEKVATDASSEASNKQEEGEG